MPNYEPGTITKEVHYVVVCALCRDEDNIGWNTMDSARSGARLHGWSKTVKHGWVCPSCKEKLELGRVRIEAETAHD